MSRVSKLVGLVVVAGGAFILGCAPTEPSAPAGTGGASSSTGGGSSNSGGAQGVNPEFDPQLVKALDLVVQQISAAAGG